MGIKSKFKNFFLLEDDHEPAKEERRYEAEGEGQPNREQSRSQGQNVVSLQSVQQSSKMMLVEPRVYAEAQEVADHLVNRRAVLVNLQRISHDQGIRIVDFLSGTVYAIGGDIQRVGTDIFLCTPDNIEVSGNISEWLEDDQYEEKRWS